MFEFHEKLELITQFLKKGLTGLRVLVMKSANNKIFRFYFVLFFLSILLIFSSTAIAFDPPHNDASGVTCGGCHGEALFSSDLTGLSGQDLHDMYEAVCLRCHDSEAPSYHGENAPVAKGHNLQDRVHSD